MRRLTEEDGAVAVLVGLMLIGLLGFGAIAVDVAALFAERRELQNGADAAALAVAENCASGDEVAACDVGPQGDRYETAVLFADENASDDEAAVATPAGVDVDYVASEVSVTATSSNDGEGFLRHWFAPILADDGSNDGTEVAAASTAIWGPVGFGSFPTLPLTFSECEYDLFLDAGAGAASEPWTVANNGGEQIIYLQGGNVHQPVPECQTGPAGQDLPGGFGWLIDVTGNSNKDECVAEFDGDTGTADPGASSPCDKKWLEDNVLNQVVYLPVFSEATADGKSYTFSTYAAFYVTGYSLPGTNAPGSKGPCENPLPSCLSGWFTTGTAPGGEVDPTAPDMGVRAVQLALN